MPSILISDVEFQTLPDGVQQTLIARFLPRSGEAVVEAAPVDDGEGPPDLSPAQAKKLISGFGSKTVELIRHIAEFPASGFKMDALEEKMGCDAGGLRGSWAGITKVSRRVLGDPDAILIWWTQMEDGSWHGRVSAMTHSSLRKALET
jgi:hypothetical protein